MNVSFCLRNYCPDSIFQLLKQRLRNVEQFCLTNFTWNIIEACGKEK